LRTTFLALQSKDSDQNVFLAKKNTAVLKTVLTGFFLTLPS